MTERILNLIGLGYSKSEAIEIACDEASEMSNLIFLNDMEITDNIKPEDMINGEIYYVRTLYMRIIRFKEIKNENIIGYSALNLNTNTYLSQYKNCVNSHAVIRMATKEERGMLINREIKRGFKWASNVPRETIIEIY